MIANRSAPMKTCGSRIMYAAAAKPCEDFGLRALPVYVRKSCAFPAGFEKFIAAPPPHGGKASIVV